MEKRKFINIVVITSLVITLVALTYNSVVQLPLMEEYKRTIEAEGNLRHKSVDERELWGTDTLSKGIDGDMLTPGTAINDIKSIGLKPGPHTIINLSDGEAVVRVDGNEYTINKNEVLPIELRETALIAVVDGYITII